MPLLYWLLAIPFLLDCCYCSIASQECTYKPNVTYSVEASAKVLDILNYLRNFVAHKYGYNEMLPLVESSSLLQDLTFCLRNTHDESIMNNCHPSFYLQSITTDGPKAPALWEVLEDFWANAYNSADTAAGMNSVSDSNPCLQTSKVLAICRSSVHHHKDATKFVFGCYCAYGNDPRDGKGQIKCSTCPETKICNKSLHHPCRNAYKGNKIILCSRGALHPQVPSLTLGAAALARFFYNLLQ